MYRFLNKKTALLFLIGCFSLKSAYADKVLLTSGTFMLSLTPDYTCATDNGKCYKIVDYLPVGSIVDYRSEDMLVYNYERGVNQTYAKVTAPSGEDCYALKKNIHIIGDKKFIVAIDLLRNIHLYTKESTIDNLTLAPSKGFSRSSTPVLEVESEDDEFYIVRVGKNLCKVLKMNKNIGLIKYVDRLSSDVAINVTSKTEIGAEVIAVARKLQDTLELRIGKSAYSSFFQALETTLSAEKLLCRLQADFNTSAGFELFSSGFKINLDFSLLEKGFAILPSKKKVTFGKNEFDFFSVLVFSCDSTSRPAKLAYYSASVVGPGAESIINNSREVHLKFESAPENSCSNSTFSNAQSPYVIDDYLSYANAEKDVINKLENKTTFLTDMDSDLRSKIIKMIIYENACFKRTKETCLRR